MKKFNCLFMLLILLACNNIKNKKNIINNYKNCDIKNFLQVANKCYEKEDYKRAIELYNKIINCDSSLGEIYFKRGNCRAFLMDYEGSNEDYFEAIKFKYRLKSSYFNLGLNEYLLFKDSLALQYFEIAKKYGYNEKKIDYLIKSCKYKNRKSNVTI